MRIAIIVFLKAPAQKDVWRKKVKRVSHFLHYRKPHISNKPKGSKHHPSESLRKRSLELTGETLVNTSTPQPLEFDGYEHDRACLQEVSTDSSIARDSFEREIIELYESGLADTRLSVSTDSSMFLRCPEDLADQLYLEFRLPEPAERPPTPRVGYGGAGPSTAMHKFLSPEMQLILEEFDEDKKHLLQQHRTRR